MLRCAALLLGICGGWLALLAVHEFGHVLHAWLSGARIVRVELPLVGFSQTHLAENPPSVWVAWGGCIWGGLIPLLIWTVTLRAARHRRRMRNSCAPRLAAASGVWAAACLIANGAYLGVGGLAPVGDAEDLLRSGVSPAILVTTGAIFLAAGLYLLHRLVAARRRGDRV